MTAGMNKPPAPAPSSGRPAAFAWAVCGVTVTLAAARLGLAIADPESSSSAGNPEVPGGGVPVAAFEAVVLIALGVIGAVVASRQPRNLVGWILCVTPLSLGLLILGVHVFWSFELAGQADAAQVAAWLSSWIWTPAIFGSFVLFPLLFPTGAPPTARWRPVAWAGVAGCVAMTAGFAFTPGEFEDLPAVNPVGLGDPLGTAAEVANGLGFLLLVIGTLTAIASIVVRFRRSRGIERQQLKWVTAAAALLPLSQVPSGDIGYAALLLGALVIAAAVAIAMLRYRLYDIDVVINRALVYGALTAILAGIYIGSVLLLQLVLSGVTQDSGLAVAASTLAVAALFRPARSRIQAVVDRRFYRRKYDAQRTLEAFSARLRDEVHLGALTTELSAVVTETLQPAHVSLWLRVPEATR
jgi:hypothetical protein